MLHDSQSVGKPELPDRSRRAFVESRELQRRLFKSSRPLVRRLEVFDGEQYTHDMGILWAAYKSGSFNMPKELGQEEFIKQIEGVFSSFKDVWIVDDDNRNFSKGRGPVGLVMANSVDLLIEAKFGFFKWATKRNMLRVMAAFLNMIRSSRKTGVCMVRTSKDRMTLPNHMKKYDLLYFVGRVSENDYLYSIRGRGGV